ncbi:MAG TPA: CGNR zinc finger domain-containing protein [Longimicrobiales bacterium]
MTTHSAPSRDPGGTASGTEGAAFIGGHIALDFANTVSDHASESPRERLTGYADLVAWARRTGSLSAADARALEREARRHPERAARALETTITLREAVYRVFSALAHHRTPDSDDLAMLHAARVRALEAAEPEWQQDRGLVLRWPNSPVDLARPLHPILLAACELLESPDLERLRQCGNPPCGWLFIDRSRNGSRRWCSSADCGNLSRVRRFRRRRASPSTGEESRD